METKDVKEEKTQIKLYINKSLEKRFKIACIKNEIKPSECILRLIRGWIRENSKDESSIEIDRTLILEEAKSLIEQALVLEG